MKKPNSRVLPEEFVKIWQTSKSRKEVANRCHELGRDVGSRAQNLRKRGVPLKRFNTHFFHFDYPKLTALAKKYAPKE